MEMSKTSQEPLAETPQFSWYNRKQETFRGRLVASGYVPEVESTEAGSYEPPPYVGPKEEEIVVKAVTPPLVKTHQQATAPPSTSIEVGINQLWSTVKSTFSISDDTRLDQEHDLAIKASLNNKLL